VITTPVRLPRGITRPLSQVGLAGCLAVASLVVTALIPAQPPYRDVDVLTLGFALVAPLALGWRRVAPLTVLTVTGLVVVLNAAAGFGIGLIQWTPWIAVFSCFVVGGLRTRLTASAIATAAVAVTSPSTGVRSTG
jgi:hypothetical protein